MQAMHAGFFFIVPFHRYITLGATLMLALSYCYCEQLTPVRVKTYNI